MKTQAQLRAELYNSLKDDITLPDEIFWVGKPTVTDTFPCIIYLMLNTLGGYAFQDGLVSEDFTVQLDVYTDVSDGTNMDIIINRLNTVMESICYRNIGMPSEMFDADINKIVRPTRWEKINV